MKRDARFDVALFTVPEAAQHLGVPPSTLRSWLLGDGEGGPLAHRVQPERPRGSSVPFIAMVEAHVLRSLRNLGLRPPEIRAAVARLRRELGTEYALASCRIASDGRSVLADLAPEFGTPHWERARDGQLLIPEVFDRYLTYITWNEGEEYPSRLKLPTYEGADVIIDPRFGFGQPVLERSKVRIEDIVDAFLAGESNQVIAGEFGIEPTEIEAILRTRLKSA